MISKTQTEQYLRAIALPEATKSYTVISHGSIIDSIREELTQNNFIIEEELYKGEAKGEIALGFMRLKNDLDPDMGMTFNWSNSYNKQLRFSCGIGGFIYDNQVPFVSANNQAAWTRKHTGTALDETLEIIKAMIESANEHFNEIVEMKKTFQNITVSRKEYAKIVGLLYFDKKIISVEQASMIRKEYDLPSFNYKEPDTLWGLYKIIMHAVKEQAPKQWYQQQVKINNYIQLLYKMVKAEDDSDDLFIEDEVETVEQTTLNLSDLEGEYTLEQMDTVIETIQERIDDAVTMSEEQIEMIETEYAYPLQAVGVREFPIDSDQYGKPFDPENPYVAGDVTLDIIPEEEKSEEFQEIDEVLVEKEQPAISFFDSIDKKSPIESQAMMIVDFSDDPKPTVVINEKGVFEETATCDNCGSTDVIFNASAQMVCDNCGHEEDTGLGDTEFDEDDSEFIEENDTTNVVLEDDLEEIFEELEDEIILPKVELEEETETPEQMNALRNAMMKEEAKVEDLFSLEDDFEFEEKVTPIQTVPDVKAFNKKIVDFASKYYADSELESSKITEKTTFTVVELNTNELFVL